MDPYIQNLFASRIGGPQYGKGTAIYKFEKIKRAKRAALAAHPDALLIDMGVGEPDEMAFPDCVAALAAAAAKPDNRTYADNGGAPFKEAAARWMQNVCGVSLDPATHIVHSIGSKSALSILPACFINPGDVALMTTPGYPVFGTHSAYYGGEVFNLPLLEKNHFLPDLAAIPPDKLKRAKTLVLNYPNNPTGASATPKVFADVVDFARRHNLIVIHDAAYAALVFEGKPLSFLATPGALDVAVELHSMSKGFNMTGWRLGFVAGNPLIVKAYADVKDNTDSGQFLAIQEACAHALDHPEITQQIAAKYSRRMDGLVTVLSKHGFSARKPKGSFFLYVKSPKAATAASRVNFETAEAFSQWLITEKLISTVPWDDAGPYVRFSVTFAAHGEPEERRILAEIDQRLELPIRILNPAPTPSSPPNVQAFIGLGSNLGDRAAAIAAAVAKLSATAQIQTGRLSKLLENPAVGGPPDSPPFLNAVLEIHTTLPPRDLLSRLLQIESDLGRQRRQKWEPRLIDLDLLLYGNQIINDPAPTFPSPVGWAYSPTDPYGGRVHPPYNPQHSALSTQRSPSPPHPFTPSPSLTLPHPHLHLRRFVLAPLAQLAPNLIHPTLGRTIQSLLDELPPPP